MPEKMKLMRYQQGNAKVAGMNADLGLTDSRMFSQFYQRAIW